MSEPTAVPEVSVDDLADHLAAGGLLLDVRNPDEWLEQRVPGVPLVPLPDLADRLAEVPRPADGTPVLVICRSGARSARAVELLRGAGIDAVNVAGGTLAWAESGRPTDSGPG